MKEVILAECDGDDYIHCCRYEQGFDYDKENPSMHPDHNGGHFTTTIFTSKLFPKGRVRITIETLDDEELNVSKETLDFYKRYHKFAVEQRAKGIKNGSHT